MSSANPSVNPVNDKRQLSILASYREQGMPGPSTLRLPRHESSRSSDVWRMHSYTSQLSEQGRDAIAFVVSTPGLSPESLQAGRTAMAPCITGPRTPDPSAASRSGHQWQASSCYENRVRPTPNLRPTAGRRRIRLKRLHCAWGPATHRAAICHMPAWPDPALAREG